MPTRTSKGGKKSPTAKKASTKTPKYTSKKIKKGTPPTPIAGVDPPIIVDGGGSVVIYSTTDLAKQPASGDYPYVYKIDVDVKWMDWNGQGHQKDKTKNGKNFRLELHDKDEP